MLTTFGRKGMGGSNFKKAKMKLFYCLVLLLGGGLLSWPLL